MLILLTAAALAAGPVAAPMAPANPHANHGMQAGSSEMHGPECKNCGSHQSGMKHEGMKDGGCCCCDHMQKHEGHGSHPATGA